MTGTHFPTVTLAEWTARAQTDLEGVELATLEGITLQPLYTEHSRPLRESAGGPWLARQDYHSAPPTEPLEGIDLVAGPAGTGPIQLLAPGSPLHEQGPAEVDLLLHRMAGGGPPPANPDLILSFQSLHESGTDMVSELAFMLCLWLDAARAGAGDWGVSLAVSSQIFLELAKVTAARQLLGRAAAVLDRPRPTLHLRNGRREFTLLDEQTNLMRTAAAAWVGAAAGCHSLQLDPYNLLTGPDELGYRLARNQHQLFRYESCLSAVADPAWGSYYLETVWPQLARPAWDLMQQVEREGGLQAWLEDGRLAAHLQAGRERRCQALAHDRLALIGTTRFAQAEAELPPLAWPDAPGPLNCQRLAVPYETLRRRAHALGNRSVRLARVGTGPMVRARLDFTQGLLAVAGLTGREDLTGGPVILCGPDDAYPEALETYRAQGHSQLAVAGPQAPGDVLCLHRGCHRPQVLGRLLDWMGAP